MYIYALTCEFFCLKVNVLHAPRDHISYILLMVGRAVLKLN